jgi:2-C-methyl-D-erythritol 2,4-cyclodiphosphate synthase
MVLLEKVWSLAYQEGWRLVNADISVLAEAPKLKPYVSSMINRLCMVLRCAPTQLAIKATTTEKLGFVGREEGIVATAVVLLSR